MGNWRRIFCSKFHGSTGSVGILNIVIGMNSTPEYSSKRFDSVIELHQKKVSLTFTIPGSKDLAPQDSSSTP
jgi:hypothetical protein